MARFMFPTFVAQNDFPMLGSGGVWRTYLGVPLRQQGELDWSTVRTSHRGASLHTSADQASGNLRRPSRDRDRERAVFQELKESLEQQTATSEILGRHRQLADGYPAGAGCCCRKRGAAL